MSGAPAAAGVHSPGATRAAAPSEEACAPRCHSHALARLPGPRMCPEIRVMGKGQWMRMAENRGGKLGSQAFTPESVLYGRQRESNKPCEHGQHTWGDPLTEQRGAWGSERGGKAVEGWSQTTRGTENAAEEPGPDAVSSGRQGGKARRWGGGQLGAVAWRPQAR